MATDIKRYKHWYEQIIDMQLLRPGITQREIAAALNKSESWVSTVMASGLYKSRFAARRAQFNTTLNQEAVERLHEVDMVASNVIMRYLRSPDCDPRFALDAKDKAMNRLGFGPQKGAGPNTLEPAAIAGAVTKEVLAHARKNMERIQQGLAQGRVINGETATATASG